MADRREPRAVGVEVEERRDEGGADAVPGPQEVEELRPPGDVLRLRLEGGDDEPAVAEAVRGGGLAEGGDGVGEHAGVVGVQRGHVRHQHDLERGVDRMGGLHQEVGAVPVRPGQGEHVEREPVEAGGAGGAHLLFEVGAFPVALLGPDGQRPVAQQAAVPLVLAVLPARVQVVAGVVVGVGARVVQRERVRGEVVREDQLPARAAAAQGGRPGQVEGQGSGRPLAAGVPRTGGAARALAARAPAGGGRGRSGGARGGAPGARFGACGPGRADCGGGGPLLAGGPRERVPGDAGGGADADEEEGGGRQGQQRPAPEPPAAAVRTHRGCPPLRCVPDAGRAQQ